MRDWLDQTIARILRQAPECVLEIGCGAGRYREGTVAGLSIMVESLVLRGNEELTEEEAQRLLSQQA